MHLPLGAAARRSCAARRSRQRSRSTSPTGIGSALGDLLAAAARPRHPPHPHDRLAAAAASVVRELLDKGTPVDFDEAFGREDRFTQAVTLFALLELHRRGEATWTQKETFGPIEVKGS